MFPEPDLIFEHLYPFRKRVTKLGDGGEVISPSHQLIKVEDSIYKIISILNERGHRALIIGGAVRDALLGVDPKDIDIEVYKISYEELEKILSQYGTADMVGRTFGTILFKPTGSDMTYDFSVPRKENKIGIGHKGFKMFFDPEMTIRDAGERRDFTFNALAYDPLENKIYDYFGGVKDLENKIIRHTSSAFSEDSLRILRAMQFQARFDFSIHPDTIAEMKRMLESSDEFDNLPRKRLFDEWMKWAGKGVRHDLIFKFMRDTGLIEKYPELKALKETPQDHIYHPEGDVEIHTAMTLTEMDKIIKREKINGDEKVLLVMSMLLHDIAKPPTTKAQFKVSKDVSGDDDSGDDSGISMIILEMDEVIQRKGMNGEQKMDLMKSILLEAEQSDALRKKFSRGRIAITSNGHEAMGGTMSRDILAGMGFHEEFITPIDNIISNHLAGVSIANITAKSGKLKAVKKLSRRLYPATIQQLMYVIEADNRGRGGEQKEPTGMSDLAELSLEADIQNKPYEALLKGRDLIAIGLKPSPKFGEIIRASFEAQEAGEFNDIEGARKWLNENVNKFGAGGAIEIPRDKPAPKVLDADVNGRGGLVVGDSHADGGVPYVLEDSGTHIEEEGEEANLPNEIKDITEVYTFTGKNHEVIHKILQLVGLKLSNKVTSVRSGDLVICKASLWDDAIRTYTGTPIQIVSAVNESEGCNHIESGATMIENGKKKKMEKGGEVGEEDIAEILYGRMSSPVMADGGRVPSKPAYLMTLEEYQKEVTPILQEYNKFIRKNGQYFKKKEYNGVAQITWKEFEDEFMEMFKGRTKDTEFYTRIPKKDLEQIIEDRIAEKKRVWSRDTGKHPEEVVPKDVMEKYREYIKELGNYFADEEINRLIEKDEVKSNKRAVRRAIDNDTYKNLLESGKSDIDTIRKVAESVGVRIPKKVESSMPAERITQEEYAKLFGEVPRVNLEKMKELVKDIDDSFKDFSQQLFEREKERNLKNIKEIQGMKDVNYRTFDSLMSYINVFEPFGKPVRSVWVKKYNSWGREDKEEVKYYPIPSLTSNWESALDAGIWRYIESLKIPLVGSILKNFNRISKPIKSVEKYFMKVGKKGLEGEFRFEFVDGSGFTFETKAIYAGGHTIQVLHLRYLSDFKNVKLSDGKIISSASLYEIIEKFSNKDAEKTLNDPYEAVANANSVSEMIDGLYKFMKSSSAFTSVRKYDNSISYKRHDGRVRGYSMYFLAPDGKSQMELPEAKMKAIKYLTEWGVKKMGNGGVTESMSIKELLKHLYKEHHDSFAIAKDLEETTLLTGEMNSERVIELWDKELDDHFKEEEERIFPRLIAMNVTLVPDVEYLIATHNKFRNDIIPKVKADRNRASVIRFASALKEHILDEEKLFREIMSDPYREITPDEMEKGGLAKGNSFKKKESGDSAGKSIPKIVKNLTKKYESRGVSCDLINQGECMNFAEELHEELSRNGIQSEIFSDAHFYDSSGDTPQEQLVDSNEFGITPKDFDEIGLPSHYWVYANGKHYDSDTPDGVEDMFELPTIRDFYLKHSKVLEKGGRASTKKLLAPNGKPSNLTPEQYALVRTSEFKNFFGDWEAFEKAKTLGGNIKGIYAGLFKNNPEQVLFEIAQQANTGEGQRQASIKMAGEELVELSLKLYPTVKFGDSFYPVVSKVVGRNGEPLVVWHGTNTEFNVFDPDKYGASDTGYLGAGVYFTNVKRDAVNYAEMAVDMHDGSPKLIPAFIKIVNPFYSTEEDWLPEGWKREKVVGFTNELKGKGYDGIISKSTKEFVVFSSTQIKLADGSNTAFDPNNPDIRYGAGGEAKDYKLNREGGYNYTGQAKEVADSVGLTTLPKKVKGTNCSNCLFQKNGFCDHEKVLLPVTKRMCCRFWDRVSFASVMRNILDADFFPEKRETFKLNAWGGYEYTGEAKKRAKEADLVTLPPDVEGTTCAEGNCLSGKKEGHLLKCIHPKILLPVTDRMSCGLWDNEQVQRSWGKMEERFFGNGGKINETNYFKNTKGVFQVISKQEYDSVDSEETVSEFKSRYKVKDGILYRSADHWGVLGSCNWSLNDKERVADLLEGELKDGLDGYSENIFAKIAFSEMSHYEGAPANEDALTKVWVSMTSDPPRAGKTPFIEVHPSLSIDDVKNVVSGKYPDYVYFKYKGTQHDGYNKPQPEAVKRRSGAKRPAKSPDIAKYRLHLYNAQGLVSSEPHEAHLQAFIEGEKWRNLGMGNRYHIA